MAGTVATQVKAIAFDRDIERLTEGFTGREWVFEEIDRWLQQDNERFFILTGEPGVGKSAIAAQLTQTRKDIAAYHFCIARQISTVEPNNVLLSLAAQLIKYFPDYGEALVNTVKPLFLQVKVEINIENIRDSVVQGVVIENLHIHYPKQALDIVLRQALEALPNPPKEPVSILIDSLDEAVTYSNENNLVTLLSSVDDLPSWVRFILTSRPDKQRVLSYFETLKPYYYHLNELSEKNKKDIHDYVDGRVVSEPIQAQIQRFQVQPEALINQITELSQGNFLYTKVLLDDIELGGQPIDNLAALPKSLNELYHNFLLRLKAEWEGKYQPIFGILTVTKAPVTEEELTNLLSEQLDETELGQRLRVVQQFFDVIQNDYAENTYTLFHQSLQDYLTDKEKSGVFHCSPKDGHRRIIEYCWQYHPRDWRECDRYGLRYLATHFVDMAALEKPPIKARKYIERLHELLATEVDGRNAWFDAKDRIGDTAGFLADVELAWSQADEAYDREPGKSIGLQCRYALIKASINSLAEIPPALMIALVKHRYWKPVKALAYIRQISDPKKRFESLVTLADQLPDTESSKHQVLQSSLQTTEQIQGKGDRAEALTVLIDKLTPNLLPIALEVAQAIQDEWCRAKALIALANKLPYVLPKALDAAQAIQDEYARVHILARLANLANKLSLNLLPKVLESTQAIQNENARAQALEVLADELTQDLFPKALEMAQAIQYEYWRSRVLKALANKLRPNLLPRALEVAQAIRNEEYRAQALTAIVDKLPEALPKALEAIQTIHNQEYRVQALTAIVDKLPEALPKVLEAIQANKDSHCTELLIVLADKLTPDLLPKALEAALAIRDEKYRAKLLIVLADKLTPDLLSKALEAALVIGDEEYRAKLLIALADKLTPDLLPKVLEASLVIEDERYHTKLLITLVDKLPEALPKALKAAQAIKKNYCRAEVLIALRDKLPEALPKALEATHAIKDELRRGELLIVLADKLTPDLLPKALEIAQSIKKDEFLRVKALTALVEKLTPDLFPKALEIAQSTKGEGCRVKALTVLVGKLPEALTEVQKAVQSMQNPQHSRSAITTLVDKLTPNLFPKILEDIQSTYQNEWTRAEVFTELVDKLTPDLLPKALEITQSIEYERPRADILITLVDKLTPDLLSKALEIAQSIKDEYTRTPVITALVDKLTPDLLPKILEVAHSTQAEVYRTEVLQSLVNKLPPDLLPKFLEVTQTIQSRPFRAEILTALIGKDNLAPDLLSTVLASALLTRDEYECTQALMALTKELPEVPPQILEIAQRIQDNYNRTQVLTVLADKLPEALPKALETVYTIHDNYRRAKALTELADKLHPEEYPKVLEAIQTVGSLELESPAQLLTALVNKLHPDLYSQALAAIQTVQNVSYRSQALTALADKLPEALPKALEAAKAIQDDYSCAEALLALSDKLPHVLPQALKLAQKFYDSISGAMMAEVYFQPYLLLLALRIRVNKLPNELLVALEEVQSGIGDEDFRVQILIVLADKLTSELLPKALQVIQGMRSESNQAQVLKALANKLTPELLPKVLEATQAIQDDYHRAQVLEALVNKLTPELFPKVLEATQAIQKHNRIGILIALRDKLPQNLLLEALDAVQVMQDASSRAKALNVLTFHLVNVTDGFNLWKNLLNFLSYRTRANLLSDVAALTPVIAALGGEAATAKTAQAIQDVSRWWH
jgi:ribosomal 50S subunit-associated protein YjgA (DUF615 family)